MKTLAKDPIKKISMEEASMICGGYIGESEIGSEARCKYIDIYRSGITYVGCFFGYDEFYIGSRRISKNLADELTVKGRDLWEKNYRESGDLVGFTREWKMILTNDYGINWDGKMGSRKIGVF